MIALLTLWTIASINAFDELVLEIAHSQQLGSGEQSPSALKRLNGTICLALRP